MVANKNLDPKKIYKIALPSFIAGGGDKWPSLKHKSPKVYGFTDAADYDEKIGPKVERWNRVLGRIKEGKEMTANNEEALAEMKEMGWDIEFIKSKLTIKNNEDITGNS